jgi:hypothetical protein
MFKDCRFVAEKKGRQIFLTIVPALIMAVLFGCGSSNLGRLQSSHEVTQAFENNQILADHQYFYSGFQRIPYGIIGIGSRYRLRSSRWKPIELNPTLLNQLAYRMEIVYSLQPRGAWILDQDGNRIGIWYSSSYQTKVVLEKDNYVVVLTPEPPDLKGGP